MSGIDEATPIPKGSQLADEAIQSARVDFPRLWPAWLLASIVGGAVLFSGVATEVVRAHFHIQLWPQRL